MRSVHVELLLQGSDSHSLISMQSCAVFDPGDTVIVVPGHGKQIRLSLRGWKERWSHKEHGANPLGENEPGWQGSPHSKELLEPSDDVVWFAAHGKQFFCPFLFW